MNSKYTGKLVEHLLDKISSLSSGDVGDFIGTGLLDKFLRKDLDERTPHSLASDKKLEVGNFVSGTAGAVIYIDELTKHSVAEIDKLYVRLKAYFEQLEIINVNSVGGKLIISPAGGIKCSLVETYDSWGYYRCYFLSEQDGEKIENRFVVGDLAYSKTFNAREGSYNKISNRYYCRLVVGVGENYIDLSKLDCDADSDEPQEGDVIVHRGNRNDVDRLNCLEFSSVDSFSPSITLYQGINDYSLADKNVIQFGVEKSTGKAFMNVYGDMFIGNRDNSSYIRYSPEKGVEIKGKLDIGTSFGDKTLLDAIDLASTAYEEDLNNLKDIVNRDILNILNLLDGAIETWFYDPAPTLTNLPASLWTTESDRNIHLGDLYYSGAGRAYRFQYDADNSLYYWQEIVDTDIVLALENAKKAQDTADSKRKIFVRKPEASDSYDIGDMWVNATYSDGNVTYTEDLLRAILSKEIGEQFSITHWTLASKYTDDTVANDALQKATEAQNSVNELLNSVGDFKDYVDNAFLDGIIDTSEAQAIEKYINLLDTIKLQVDKSYEEIIKNSILENTLYLTNLNNSYTAFSSSYTELINTINSAISDSKTTDLEKAAVDGKYKTFNDKYRDYTAYLNLTINYIEETINGKVERALLDIGGYKYLKAALLENTSIEGGLIQSSMLSLGYTKNNLFLVMAGTNGLVLDKGDRTIASWFGGGMVDMFDYYDSNTKTFNVPEDVRAAAGLDRMDGTGYRAKGNLWWDETGVIHADPLSFFVGESTVGGLLASFLVVMKEDGKHPLYLIPQVPFLSLEIADYIRIGDALLKYDSTNKAIYVTSADGTTSMGFYASGYVSALGKNSSGSSAGSASALYQLVDVLANSTNDGVQGATTNSVLMYNGTKWYAGTIDTGLDETALKAYLDTNKYTTTTYIDNKISTINNQISNIDNQVSTISGQVSSINSQISTINSQLDTKADKTALDAYLLLSGGTITGDLTVNGTIYVGTTNYVYHTGNLAGDNAWITLSSDTISHKTIHANNITLIASSGQFVTGYTVDKAGHIVSISQRALNASDIPNIAITQVTGLQDALDKKVDNVFFARVFGLLDADGNEIAVNDVTTVADSIKAKFGLWTEQYISAKGKSSSTGGGGGASALYQLVDVAPNSTNDGVLNAANGSVLMYNGSKWQAGNVVTDISPLTLNVNGSSLFTYDGKSSITANLTVPTKVSQLTNDTGFITGISSSMVTSALGYTPYNSTNPNGYISGITKAMVEGVLTGNITSHTHSFVSLTSKPTTISGYGITDAITTNNIGSQSVNYATSSGDADTVDGYHAASLYKLISFSRSDGSKDCNDFKSNAIYTFNYDFNSTSNTLNNRPPNSSIDGGCSILTVTHGEYSNQIFFEYGGGSLWFRGSLYAGGHAWQSWKKLALSGEPQPANGGNADTATALTTSAGSDTLPIYFSSGKPIACTMSTGNGAGIVRSFGRSTYTSANQYFGNGTIVTIDPKGTGCISANNTILSLGDSSIRNTQLLVAYDIDGVYYRRIVSSLSYGDWKRLAFTTDNVASATNADMLDGWHLSDITERWASIITIGQWSRLLKATNNSLAGSFILSIHYTRNSVVANNVFLITFGHSNNAKIVTLGTHGYSQFQLRITSVGNANDIYVEILDTYDNMSTQEVSCQIFNAYVGSITKYTSYTAGGGTVLASTSTVSGRIKVNDDIVAFTYDNVASATKLQTPRTIWGQSFDGTGNVSGDLTGVTNLTASGYVSDAGLGYTSNRIQGVGWHTVARLSKWNCSADIYISNAYLYHPSQGLHIRIANGVIEVLSSSITTITKVRYIADEDGDIDIYYSVAQFDPFYWRIIGNGCVNADGSISTKTGGHECEVNVGVSINSNLTANGNISATGAITAKASSSDIRLKTDITDYKALSIIRSHKSIKYHWNAVAKANADVFNDDYWHYGLIAQDVQRDMPQMVSDVFKDYLVINYERLIPICWKGLQEVDDEVTKLKKKVRKLEMEIRELKQKEDRL